MPRSKRNAPAERCQPLDLTTQRTIARQQFLRLDSAKAPLSILPALGLPDYERGAPMHRDACAAVVLALCISENGHV